MLTLPQFAQSRHSASPMPVFSRLHLLCAGMLLAVASAAHATAPDAAALAAAEQKFADELARDNHLKREAVLATLAKARYQQSVIDAISRPAEAKPWKDYRPIFVTDRRIDDGVAFLEGAQPRPHYLACRSIGAGLNKCINISRLGLWQADGAFLN